MDKPLRPTDRRLKANRDFGRFMMRVVQESSLLGELASEPKPVQEDTTFEVRFTRANGDLRQMRDSDLVVFLRFLMLRDGIKPLSQTDNVLAHLRERIAKRERAEW